MNRLRITVYLIVLYFISLKMSMAQTVFEKDTFSINGNSLIITFIGHATLVINFNDVIIHVDPWSKLADYKDLPKADLILITHNHQDHLDTTAIATISRNETTILQAENCADMNPRGIVMKNGESRTISGIEIEAVPAYNIKHKRLTGIPFHPKGEGNGYILHFDTLTVYIAGDTEDIPEMKSFGKIDIAFIPVNLPYTMDIDMAVKAARMLAPNILYPYHFGETEIENLSELLKEDDIEIRYRKMK